jgi:aminoglycoside phosphotransferase (APT) family kinase protein
MKMGYATMIAHTNDPSIVADSLLHYLQDRLGTSGLRYQLKPELIPDGWEVYNYRLQLEGRSVPAQYRRPLILHLYHSEQGLPLLHHEYEAQQHMRKLTFPVARPVLAEEDPSVLGGPFMLMERLPGETLMESMLRKPWEIIGGTWHMVRLQIWLHSLPTDVFPAAAEPFLDRWLTELGRRVESFELAGLAPGLAWLQDNRPPNPRALSIVHMDFHPVNLMVENGKFTGVLDWPGSDVADYHADVATTLVLLETTRLEMPSLVRRALAATGRAVLRDLYFGFYRRQRPIDPVRLRYYLALASLRRLTRWGMWKHASPRITGTKPKAMGLLRGDRIQLLERCFERRTGVEIRLGEGF